MVFLRVTLLKVISYPDFYEHDEIFLGLIVRLLGIIVCS